MTPWHIVAVPPSSISRRNEQQNVLWGTWESYHCCAECPWSSVPRFLSGKHWVPSPLPWAGEARQPSTHSTPHSSLGVCPGTAHSLWACWTQGGRSSHNKGAWITWYIYPTQSTESQNSSVLCELLPETEAAMWLWHVPAGATPLSSSGMGKGPIGFRLQLPA